MSCDTILNIKLQPAETGTAITIVEVSNPTDKFLVSVAQACGLMLKYERDKLVFIKQENRNSSNKTGGR